MQTQAYTTKVYHIIQELREHFKTGDEQPRFSDICDAEGNQYVNLVQEGGGVLGIALVGFTYVLEEMGIRFLSLGGTSAGSINALLMADAGHPGEAKSLKVLEKVQGVDFSEFVDGGRDARFFISQMAKGNYAGMATGLTFNVDELLKDYGINPGKYFKDWLMDNLECKTWSDLRGKIRDLNKDLYLVNRNGERIRAVSPEELDLKLAIVAADITTQTKVEFPRMAELYYQDPDGTNPAEFVRASMSIPFFFEPQKVSLAWAKTPSNEHAVRDRWDELADYNGPLPDEALLVDGGVMSNFPIDLLHRDGQVPLCPTFGIKLGADRKGYKETKGPVSFMGNLFEGVRNLRDHEFLMQHPQYKKVVSYVDVDDYDWLNFSLTEDDRTGLFLQGAKAAAAFLRTFKWNVYKREIRNDLLQRIKPLVWELGGSKSLEDKLGAFRIEEKSELYRKIARLRKREKPYRAIWLDDQFTYVLPIAILEELNISVEIVQHSDEALRLLNRYNGQSADVDERFYLVISDGSRAVRGEKDPLAGIHFAQDLEARGLDHIPIIIYATNQEKLLARYRKHEGDPRAELPKNIKNTNEWDNVRHHDFIAEVVGCLYASLFPDG